MMNNIKFLWGIIGCLVLLLAIGGWKYTVLSGSSKVAVVGNTVITRDDLNNELTRQYGQIILNKMIDKEVVSQYAKRNKIIVSDEELNGEWKGLRDRYQVDNDETLFAKLENATGRTPSDFKEELRYSLLLEKIATIDVKISDGDEFKYYEQNREKFNQPPMARVAAIYLNSKSEAEQVVTELKQGSNFNTLAKERSTDGVSAANGGDLGWVSLLGDDVGQQIIDEVKKLKEGQVSGLVPLEKGFVVIKLMKKKDANIRTFNEAKTEIKREMALDQVGPLDTVLEKLKKGLQVQVLLPNGN